MAQRSTTQSPKTMISSELTDSRAAECSNRLRRAATVAARVSTEGEWLTST